MKTYPIKDEAGRSFALELDVVFCSVRDLIRTISAVDGVTDAETTKLLSKRTDVRAKFRFFGEEFVVVEPFGDNSRYWIGPVSKSLRRDLAPIERQLNSYVPSLLRRILGKFLTLNLKEG